MQYLEDLHHSVNRYFLNDSYIMFQSHFWNLSLIKFEVQDLSLDFSITGHEKSTDMISDFILQLTLKKPPLVEFLSNIKEEYLKSSEKLLKHSSPFPRHKYVKLGFLLMLQSNNLSQDIECRSRHENPTVFYKPDTKQIYRNIK